MPTRYLKPGVRDSEAIESLSPEAEILFYRLIVTVDDFGRFDGRPAMVKAHCFPVKNITQDRCSELMADLSAAGLLTIYSIDGKPYLQMCKWDNVPRAKVSKYPACADGCAQVHTHANIPRTLLPVTVTVTETETDQTPPRKRSAPTQLAKPEDVAQQTWDDWLTLRKAKKAPATDTVVASARREAEKAEMPFEDFLQVWCRRGSQGLDAAWLKPDERGKGSGRQNPFAGAI